MSKALSTQKVLMTGDEVIFQNKPSTIHYVVEKDNQMSFSSRIMDAKSVILQTEKGIQTVSIKQIKLQKGA